MRAGHQTSHLGLETKLRAGTTCERHKTIALERAMQEISCACHPRRGSAAVTLEERALLVEARIAAAGRAAPRVGDESLGLERDGQHVTPAAAADQNLAAAVRHVSRTTTRVVPTRA